MLSSLWRWWTGLARVTSSGRFIAEVDALRFFAIAGVVVHHLGHAVLDARAATATDGQHAFVELLGEGAFGVQLFFAISGFILALPFVEHYRRGGPAVSLPKYFLRRVTRLEPPYIASLLLLFALKVVTRHLDPSALAPHLLASATYSHAFVYHTVSAVNGVAWSLEVEVQFYVLVPLLARVFALRHDGLRRGVIAAVMLGVVALQRSAFGAHPWLPHWASLTIVAHLQFFLAGFILADLYALRWAERPASSRAADFGWYLGWVALAAARLYGGAVGSFALPFIVLALYACFFRSRARRTVCHPAITVTGGMCYSIYLLHNSVLLPVSALTARLPLGFYATLAVAAALSVPAVLLSSAVFFRFVERPCMDKDWPLKLWRALVPPRPRVS